jgi:multidrug efflux pump
MLATILSRPKTVLTLMAVVLAAGVYAYVAVPKEANPDIDVPVFYVSVIQSGISPEDAERLLIRPMETRLRGLDGLKEITAVASENHAGVILEFNIDFDKDAALADVRAKVDEAQAELPDDAEEPRILETNFSLVPTIIVTLSGDVPERTLYSSARRLKDRIEAIPTVLRAELSGHREELLEVVIDLVKLESYGITQDELLAAVQRNNRLVPAGALDTGRGRFNVKVPGLFETAGDVYSLPVKVNDDAVVTLADVAVIGRTFKDATSYSRFNGKPTIAIKVVKRLGTNIIDNNNEVRKVVAAFSADWPDTIRIGYTLDQSRFIFEVLDSLQSAIMTAIALVMIVVVAVLGMRSALLVGIAIPTSFMIGFALVDLIGMTVNMMVMFGLVLTVGMLVDGAIVIVEYADRKMAEGMGRREAYALAAHRMLWPVTSSTATTLAAFLPMLLWPGIPGEFMSYLPIMVIIVLTAALVTAMVFLPTLGGIIGGTAASEGDKAVARHVSGAGELDHDEVRGLTGIYVRTLASLVRRPATVITAAVAFAVAVFYAYGQFNNGIQFFVDEEPEQAIVLVSARGNLSAMETRDLVVEVEREVLEVNGIRNVFTTAGSGGTGGGPQIGEVQDKPVDEVGELMIELEDFGERRRATEIFAEIRERAAGLAGIKVEVRKVEGGPQTGKNVRLEITADDLAAAQEAAKTVRHHFDTGIDGLIDIEDTTPLPGIEWHLKVDREEAGRFGTDIASIGAMIQLITNGVLIGTYRPDDAEDEIDIRVRLPAGQRSIEQLDQLRVHTPQGAVPIGNLVTREANPQVSSITRVGGRYAFFVKANVAPGLLADDKVREIGGWLAAQSWPDQVQFRFRGADEEQKESGAFLAMAAMGALFLMFVILVTQFDSFYQTALTLSTVVMSMIGVLIGMMVTGQPFSIIMTGTGIVALAGIVVNNAIVLIDTFNRLRAGGIATVDAVLKAAAQRVRPILLTTVTTIMGLIPMATQVTIDFIDRTVHYGGVTSIWWVQLSTAVIFGLAFSTVLTLIIVPTMLALPAVYGERWREVRARWNQRRSGQEEGPAIAEPAE